MDKKLNIHFGSTAPRLVDQIGEILNIEIYQQDADAIVRLYLRGIITNAEKQSANKKLFKMIEYQIYGPQKSMTGNS